MWCHTASVVREVASENAQSALLERECIGGTHFHAFETTVAPASIQQQGPSCRQDGPGMACNDARSATPAQGRVEDNLCGRMCPGNQTHAGRFERHRRLFAMSRADCRHGDTLFATLRHIHAAYTSLPAWCSYTGRCWIFLYPWSQSRGSWP